MREEIRKEWNNFQEKVFYATSSKKDYSIYFSESFKINYGNGVIIKGAFYNIPYLYVPRSNKRINVHMMPKDAEELVEGLSRIYGNANLYLGEFKEFTTKNNYEGRIYTNLGILEEKSFKTIEKVDIKLPF